MDEKEFDFGHLTKEQTLYLHRKLWNTLADKILEWKRPVEKWEIFVLYDWPKVYADCWCCEYSKNCNRCPIEWTSTGWICSVVYSPYKKWKILMDKYIADAMDKYCLDGEVYKFKDEQLKELYDSAKEIANLPERK